MEFTLDAYESGFNTVLTYATVAINTYQNNKNHSRSEMLLEKCEEYKKIMIHTGELQIKDFEDEDIVLLLADMAEEFIEEQFIKCLSIESSTKHLRKDRTTVSFFKECIKDKSEKSINQYYIKNGIDDDILLEKIQAAIIGDSNQTNNDLIDNNLKRELRQLTLNFVREKLNIKEVDKTCQIMIKD